MSTDRPAENPATTPAPPDTRDTTVQDAGRFALSEDWLATIAGLALVVLMMLGIVTADWLPW